jgi:hypothetical protein
MRWIVLLAACHSSTLPPGTLRNRGVVTADSHAWKSGPATYGQGSIAAGFVREQTDPFLGCQRRSFGSCSVHYDCQPVHVEVPDLATTSDLGVSLYASAGDISVTGLPMPVMLQLITMGMFAGQYGVYMQYMPMFSGGENLLFSAAGGEVPAFGGQVTAPAQPTILVPARTQTRLQRAQDLALQWTGGGAGELRVSIAVPQMTSTPGIDCAFPANLGVGSIPSAALQTLPAGSGFLSASVVSESDVFAGDWQVAVTATTGTLDQAGNAWDQIGITLQ